MDYEHFRALHDEYAGKHGCSLSADILFKLIGGTPGLIPQLCEGARVEALKWLEAELTLLDEVVSKARVALGARRDEMRGPRRVLKAICTLLGRHGIDLAEEPVMDELGQLPTERNPAYLIHAGVYSTVELEAHVLHDKSWYCSP